MEPNPNWLLPVILVAVPLAFAVFWCGVVLLIAVVSGWRELAQHYTRQKEFKGQRWGFQAAYLRLGARYNRVLTVGADDHGLFLQPMPLFRPGHRALFIPWADLAVETGGAFGLVTLRARRATRVPIRIWPSLADKLAKVAGAAWPRTG